MKIKMRFCLKIVYIAETNAGMEREMRFAF